MRIYLGYLKQLKVILKTTYKMHRCNIGKQLTMKQLQGKQKSIVGGINSFGGFENLTAT